MSIARRHSHKRTAAVDCGFEGESTIFVAAPSAHALGLLRGKTKPKLDNAVRPNRRAARDPHALTLATMQITAKRVENTDADEPRATAVESNAVRLRITYHFRRDADTLLLYFNQRDVSKFDVSPIRSRYNALYSQV